MSEISQSENQLALPPEAADLMVVAERPDQMRAAQEKTISWVKRLMTLALEEKISAEANLESARRHKWRLEGFKRHVAEAQRKAEFYEKLQAALEAGYVIVPNFPVDVFAIRTTKVNPVRGDTHSNWVEHKQKSNRPPLGEGAYVDSRPTVHDESWTEKNDQGKDITKHTFWADTFLPVDFPLKLVSPQIMDATARAMALKAFDEFGVLPNRRAVRRGGKNADPMVVGQVVYKAGSPTEKRVTFLVAWWLNESDLRV